MDFYVPNKTIIIICQMGRFNGLFSDKWGNSMNFLVSDGAIIIICQMRTIQWIFKCQMRRLLLYVKWGN